jgi:nicotinamide-nucleotide adenylyltransferase
MPFHDREVYSATEIRERVVRGEDWDKLVPASVATYIKEIFGDERLRELALSDDPKHLKNRHQPPF